MVEVFTTNVDREDQSDTLVMKLLPCFPGTKINFDLEDRDKILRVEGDCSTAKIMEVLHAYGYRCSILE